MDSPKAEVLKLFESLRIEVSLFGEGGRQGHNPQDHAAAEGNRSFKLLTDRSAALGVKRAQCTPP